MGRILQRGEAAHKIVAVRHLPGGLAWRNGNPGAQVLCQLYQADKLPVEIAVDHAAFGSGREQFVPHCNYDDEAWAGAAHRKMRLAIGPAPKMRMVPVLALSNYIAPRYVIRQILLAPSSAISSEPSFSTSRPAGRPQTSRLSGLNIQPVMKSS